MRTMSSSERAIQRRSKRRWSTPQTVASQASCEHPVARGRSGLRPPRQRDALAAVAAAPVAASSAVVGASLLDLRAGRRDGVPLGAERLQFLALRLPGLPVLREPVQRVLLVGHL